MQEANTNMKMSFVELTPALAKHLLEHNEANRRLSLGLVNVYAQDIKDGNWDENVGAAISVDGNGVLRDGQHRCAAVIQAGIPIKVWICRNVDSKGIYDNNRKRTTTDQIIITRPDLDKVFRQTRTISVVRALIQHKLFRGERTAVSSKQIMDYIDAHKSELETFFTMMPSGTITKISLGAVYLSLYLAFLNGVDINSIVEYYKVLADGMSSSPKEYPIIGYRNYLMNSDAIHITIGEIARCQYSLKKYLSGSCTKRSLEPKELIWKFPND